MNKYNEAFTSLVIMLSGALREEFVGNEKIEKDLEVIKELLELHKAQKHNINELLKLSERLDKALEEAIEYHILPKCTNKKEKCLDGDCIKCWKEYLLKESEEQ